ncbi:MAG: radical SAM protein [Bryobacteraceae bacterium]
MSYFNLLADRVRPRAFNSLFLFVTSRCNSVCRTCFYFDKLNSRDDLTFEQIQRISETAPRFRKLWLSGGEPTLRAELGEICAMFARNNGVENVNLPTNGLVAEKVFAAVDRIARDAPETAVDLNFSFDGLANTHDAIRGVPNNFERSLQTLREATRRYAGNRRIRCNVVSVITRENYDEMVRLGLYMLENADADGQYFETMRGQAPDPSLKDLDREQLARLHARLMPFHRRYAKKLFAHLPAGVRHAAEIYYLGNLRFHFDLHEQCFEQPQRWPMPCTAGQTSLVIDHNGKFRACEMREPVGDIAHWGYDVRAALESGVLTREVAAIGKAGCWCTHSCFIQDSSKFSPRVQLFEIPWAWWRQRKNRLGEASLDEVARYKALELA